MSRSLLDSTPSGTASHDSSILPSRPAEDRALPIDLALSFRDSKEAAIADFEKRYLQALLEWAEGNVSRAARRAKMDRMNLHRLLQKHGLRS